MKFLILVVCFLIGSAVCDRVERNFFDSADACDSDRLATRFYYFKTNICYRVNTLTTEPSCTQRNMCLDQGLEWSDLEDCYATAVDESLVQGSGSFRVAFESNGINYRYNYLSNDCSGMPTLTELSECVEDTCSGFARWSPYVRTNDESSDSSSDSKSDEAVRIGLGVGIGVLGLLVFCCVFCGIVIVCFLVLLIIILTVSIIIYIIGRLSAWIYRRQKEKEAKAEDSESSTSSSSDTESGSD